VHPKQRKKIAGVVVVSCAQAVQRTRFIDSIGVNAHMDSVARIGWMRGSRKDLSYVGSHNIRDGTRSLDILTMSFGAKPGLIDLQLANQFVPTSGGIIDVSADVANPHAWPRW